MKETGLISLLKTFSLREMKEFDKFLRSPYFTEGKNIRHRIIYGYFKLLSDYHPDYSNNGLTKEHLYSELYPGSKYNDGIMRKLNSDLTSLAEQFLLQEEFASEKFEQKRYALISISKRGLDKHFNKIAYEADCILENDKLRPEYYENKENLVSIINNNAYFKTDMLKMYDLQKEADYFFFYFLCRALELYRNMKNHGTIFNIDYKYPFIEHVLNYLQENDSVFKNNPLIAMHYNELMINLKREEV